MEIIVSFLAFLASSAYPFVSGDDLEVSSAISALSFSGLWVVCVLVCMLAVKTAFFLHRDDIADFNNYKPILLIVGEYPERIAPSALKPTLAAVALIILCVGAAYSTLPYLPKVKPGLSIDAILAPGSQEGDRVSGVVWKPQYSDIRISAENITGYPITGLDLTVSIEKGGALLGMVQVGDLAGCDFHQPDYPDLRDPLKGLDGKTFTLSTRDMLERFVGKVKFSLERKVYCSNIPVGL